VPAAAKEPAKPTLMLLDGNSLAFRAFYALPAENFKTRGGLTTNAVYGFTAMLINLLRDEAPTHIAAAFDVSRQTFRSERYPEYKANRSSTPDEFHGQIDITKEVLGALGITVLAEAGFEPTTSSRRWPPRPKTRATGSWWSPATATRCSW
jgi:DNA polymerase I